MKKNYLFLLIILLAILQTSYAFDSDIDSDIDIDTEINNRIINTVEITFDNNGSMSKFLPFANLQCEFTKPVIVIDNIIEDTSEDMFDSYMPVVIYYFEPCALEHIENIIKTVLIGYNAQQENLSAKLNEENIIKIDFNYRILPENLSI